MTETARRPRVLMLTSTLPRWEGDSEPRFVLDLAKRLSADFDIELVAPHAPGAVRHEVLEGIPVTRFRYWIPRWQSVAYEGGISWRLKENRWRLFQLPFFFVSQLWHIGRRIGREPGFSVIHAHWIVPQGLAALLARNCLGARCPSCARVMVVTCSAWGGGCGQR
jgi:phosphatidyl-myo-inositol dimannoside synthase